ncbi:hypothetical protein FNH13_17950 [Ornithinimicrobium ciconiae]|uniref:Toprim domain-containing protein n=1 Tax=Ornithinimicrobium ciconiae TaxID=2594265 RepID=A0A516GEL7_9MICO|nr:toprim domain-containing protein [Ornithinimicrobium ciconiae]QDO89973.1 hypothetical protein FNH13_17950 [Ornithinimicrobium ciconiae]
MTWRISVLTDPPPVEDTVPAAETAHPEEYLPGRIDLDVPSNVATDTEWDSYLNSLGTTDAPAHHPETTDAAPFDTVPIGSGDLDAGLALAALVRETLGPLEYTDAELDHIFEREMAARESVVPVGRLAQVNAMALEFYEDRFATNGWARDYLSGRFGQDVAGHPHIHPGYAPAGRTTLLDHLRDRGVSDLELTQTGLATTTRHGRLIDRFRDRALFPIHDTRGHVLGFIGRRNPEHTDNTPHAGPKYLNTPSTPLFNKGDQLYGLVADLLASGATPVLVEGPMDAHAVTLAGHGRYVGVAPLGTALTETQARQLAAYSPSPLVATDADLPGRLAAERDHWLLSQHNLTPLTPTLPPGSDPADLLERRGPDVLRRVIDDARPLAETLLEERLANLPPAQALPAAATVLATHSPTSWDPGTASIAETLGITQKEAHRTLHKAIQTWHTDPRRVVATQLDNTHDVKTRMEERDAQAPEARWVAVATQIDSRLPHEADWPALARVMQQLHNEGHDVAVLAQKTVAEEPLADRSAQDLRYRLITELPSGHVAPRPTNDPTKSRAIDLERRSRLSVASHPDQLGPSR